MKQERTRRNVIIETENLIREYDMQREGCFISGAQVVC